MFQEVITSKTKQDLALLAKVSRAQNFYLAGGTGLALQIGHRISHDLDFFTKQEFRPEILAAKLTKLGKFSLRSKDRGTLHGIFNKTRITFLSYPYPLLFPTQQFLKIKIADWRDIACMKLDAVSGRGSKKDFIDLYFVCQKMSLKTILKLFGQKYKKVNFNLIFILKSLTYFEEAEKEPMPKMLQTISWLELKKYFQKESKKIFQSLLKI